MPGDESKREEAQKALFARHERERRWRRGDKLNLSCLNMWRPLKILREEKIKIFRN
jgi:hypothetical protein